MQAFCDNGEMCVICNDVNVWQKSWVGKLIIDVEFVLSFKNVQKMEDRLARYQSNWPTESYDILLEKSILFTGLALCNIICKP